MRHGPFPRTDESQPFAGRRFHRDLLDRKSQNLSNVLTHHLDMRGYFGLLQDHGSIDIDNSVAMMCQEISHMLEEEQAGAALVSLVGIGKMFADISQGSCSQQCIRDRMKQDIGIRMSVQPSGTRDVHATEDQLPVLHQTMDIISKTDAQ